MLALRVGSGRGRSPGAPGSHPSLELIPPFLRGEIMPAGCPRFAPRFNEIADILSRMAAQDITEQRFNEVREADVKQFERALHRFSVRAPKRQKLAEAREKQQLAYMQSIGIKLDQLDKDQRKASSELKALLETIRPPLIARPSERAADSQQQATHAAVLGETAHLVLPPFGASLLSAYPILTEAQCAVTTGTGWIFPCDPSQIKISANDTGHGSGWGATGQPPPTQYNTYFTFIPPAIANYEMTAIYAFHGFYVLKADDGFFTHKKASVKVNVSMTVNQYADIVQQYPSPLDEEGDNLDEVETFDGTYFFDQTVVLKQGDPVIVTVSVSLEATASGSGSYAEINFNDGTANYILPMFLSVQAV
jgi:hypothetical protein